jgi:hypothetical protein
MMHDVAGRIAARMLFTGRSDRAEVAREIAKEDRHAGLHRRLAAASHPVPPHHHDDVHRTLLDKVLAAASRLFVDPSSSSRPEPSPQPPARRRLVERLADAIAPEPTRSEPSPTPQPPTIRSSQSSGAVLIGDEEYSARYRDQPTANWRKSIADNDRLLDERRGRPAGKINLYIG